MAPSYKLTYFSTEALAEPIRWLFCYADIAFEDVRIDMKDWPKAKPTFPYGVLPVLEHNGKIIGQSMAIARYAAKKAKMVGDNDWENLEIDAIVDSINDIRLSNSLLVLREPEMSSYYWDEHFKQTQGDALNREIIPFYLQRFEETVKRNNGHLALGRLTWADFYLAALSTYWTLCMDRDVLVDYPNLCALREKVSALPAIAAWIKRRPAHVPFK